MSGIYIHIPFCKQACNYCNFHFSTSLRYKNELLAALLKEIGLQSPSFLNGSANEPVETVYFGGGTPSLLEASEVATILEAVRGSFNVTPGAEITLEANPDDLEEAKLKAWKLAGINRLSIGVQSFFEEDLRWMNRAHNAVQAERGLKLALEYFDNITIDLIYGTPGLTDKKWKQNVETAIALGIPHLSCYALTVEPKTPLQKLIEQHKTEDVDPDHQSEQFLLLMKWLKEAGYEHYEISNFAKPGFRSRHNSAYWQGKKYIGIGPSAHSFDGRARWWNVANNQVYIRSLREGKVPFEKEELTPVQRINEFIMIALRTMEGLDLDRLKSNEFGLQAAEAVQVHEQLLLKSNQFIERGLMKKESAFLRLTDEGRLLADGIAAELFF